MLVIFKIFSEDFATSAVVSSVYNIRILLFGACQVVCRIVVGQVPTLVVFLHCYFVFVLNNLALLFLRSLRCDKIYPFSLPRISVNSILCFEVKREVYCIEALFVYVKMKAQQIFFRIQSLIIAISKVASSRIRIVKQIMIKKSIRYSDLINCKSQNRNTQFKMIGEFILRLLHRLTKVVCLVSPCDILISTLKPKNKIIISIKVCFCRNQSDCFTYLLFL